MLDYWGIDLSNCRTELHVVEIIELILGAPSNKQPGPDGLPSEYHKYFAKSLAPIYKECWAALMEGQEQDPAFLQHLGERKWVVVPKTQNASTTDKLRDLELLNETRETRARTVNRVLDEQFRTRLHPSQQTFITNGDISRNLTML